MTTETETRTGLLRFSDSDTQILLDNNFSIFESKERSLSDFEKIVDENGQRKYRFVAFPKFLKNKEKVFSEKARATEIAYIPTGIYLPDSYRYSSSDQQQLLNEIQKELSATGLKNVIADFPTVADAIEIADELSRRGINIFGKDFGYLYTRTSTSNDQESSVIVGCNDLEIIKPTKEEIELYGYPDYRYRGIHIEDFPKDSNMHAGLNLILALYPSYEIM